MTKKLVLKVMLAYAVHWIEEEQTKNISKFLLGPAVKWLTSRLNYMSWQVWNYCLSYHDAESCPRCLRPKTDYRPWYHATEEALRPDDLLDRTHCKHCGE
jgi:hypothetical protein